LWEFADLVEACKQSEEFQKAVSEFQLPEGFELVVEPWYVEPRSYLQTFD
jgi:primary-amine oxidase